MKAKAYIVHQAMCEPELEWRKPKDCLFAEPLYAKREWIGLTEEEIETLIHRFDGDPHTLLDEVNARLKRKNT